jgi:hypothetical protein
MPLFTYTAWGINPSTNFDPNYTFVRSHFVSPLVLASIRLTLCIYIFTSITTSYIWLTHNTATIHLKDFNISPYIFQQSKAATTQSFSYFTYLTFYSLGFYFLVSSIHTFRYAFRQWTWLHSWPRYLQLAHSLYYSTITTFPILVTVVFWGTMNSGWPVGRFEQWVNISVHGLNSIFAVTELMLSATAPPPVTHLSFLLLVLSGYLGLAYLTQYTQGFYVYEWMNPAHGVASILLHVVGYAGGMVIIFFLVRYAIVGRNALAKKVAGESVGEGEKALHLDDKSEVWSGGEVQIARPKQARTVLRYSNRV